MCLQQVLSPQLRSLFLGRRYQSFSKNLGLRRNGGQLLEKCDQVPQLRVP
jgi:hypothetical protein